MIGYSYAVFRWVRVRKEGQEKEERPDVAVREQVTHDVTKTLMVDEKRRKKNSNEKQKKSIAGRQAGRQVHVGRIGDNARSSF